MWYRNHDIRYSVGRDSKGLFYAPVIDGECTMGEWERTPEDALETAKRIVDEMESRCPVCGGIMTENDSGDVICLNTCCPSRKKEEGGNNEDNK